MRPPRQEPGYWVSDADNRAFTLLWPSAMDRQARDEGWSVFYLTDADRLEIQKWDSDQTWSCDLDCIRDVAVMAVFGDSSMHQLALSIEYNAHKAEYDASINKER